MSTKVYQLTQEQVDMFSNDIVEVLQEISTVYENIKKENVNVKNIFDENNKNEKLVSDIDFLLNNIAFLKNDLTHNYSNVENLSKLIEQNIDKLNYVNKKSISDTSFKYQNKNTHKSLLVFSGFLLGIFLTFGFFAFSNNGFSIISNSFKNSYKITKGYYEKF